jgi:hypothetical protein
LSAAVKPHQVDALGLDDEELHGEVVGLTKVLGISSGCHISDNVFID